MIIMRNNPWIDISLDNLLHNLGEIRRVVPARAGIMAVVKDSAYGCGALPVARILEDNGVGHFAVAQTSEACALRDTGITSPILVLGEASAEDLHWAADKAVSYSLNDMHSIDLWESCGIPVSFHCNVDTGMGRLGLANNEIQEAARRICSNTYLRCEGIYTHLACADAPGTQTVNLQLERFLIARTIFNSAGIHPRHVHYANTAGFTRFPPTDATLVRPGIALYGCNPDPAQDFGLSLKSVAMLKGPVVKCKKVASGTPLSYGHRYITSGDTTIATVHVGYAHGVPRALTGKGRVLLRGESYPIAGTITMDYLMVDIGCNSSVIVGDEAVVLGEQGQQCISADEIAKLSGTIGYEVLCGLSARVDRFYHYGGSIVAQSKGITY